MVVEEADAATIHGRDYEPATAHIAPLLADLDHPQVLALTEAVDPCALEAIPERLGARLPRPIIIEPLPPDVRLEVRLMRSPGDADAHLLALLDAGPERALVMVSEGVEAERLAELIADECELPTEPVQRGSPESAGTLRRFREGGARVLVATGILGRDARWPEVPLIVQHSLPPSIEHWRRTCLLAGRRKPVRTAVRPGGTSAVDSLAWHCAPEPAISHCTDGRDLAGALAAECLRTAHRSTEPATGLEALIAMARCVSGRGDDWIAAEAAAPPGPLSMPSTLMRCAGHARSDRLGHRICAHPALPTPGWRGAVPDVGVTRGCAWTGNFAAKKSRQPRHAPRIRCAPRTSGARPHSIVGLTTTRRPICRAIAARTPLYIRRRSRRGWPT